MLRLKRYLGEKGLWNEEIEEEILKEAEEKVNKVVEAAESYATPDVEDIFRYTYAEVTPAIQEQMDDYLSFLKEKGE
jgi:pyruvate dehydrogenase E1 component alpha subunit